MQNGKRLSWEEAVLWLKSQPEQAKLVRDCFFDDPLLAAAERYYLSSEWAAVRRLLPRPPGKALDLGAGRGICSYALARDGWDTVALEPDASPLIGAGAIRALAAEAGLDIQVVQDWGERLPFPPATFDLVYGRQVLHHARDLAQLCRELGRVLKKGGVFLATREHVISRPADLPEFLAKHPLHRLYGGEHAHLLQEYTDTIRQGGLVLTRVINPWQSNINLFPETMAEVKTRLARRIKFPFPRLIPDFLVAWLGARLDSPGRLYTFLGHKSS